MKITKKNRNLVKRKVHTRKGQIRYCQLREKMYNKINVYEIVQSTFRILLTREEI